MAVASEQQVRVLSCEPAGRGACKVVLEAGTREALDCREAREMAKEAARQRNLPAWGIQDQAGPFPVDARGDAGESTGGVAKIAGYRLEVVLSAGPNWV